MEFFLWIMCDRYDPKFNLAYSFYCSSHPSMRFSGNRFSGEAPPPLQELVLCSSCDRSNETKHTNLHRGGDFIETMIITEWINYPPFMEPYIALPCL
jgi:hypothetical protein